MLVQEHNWLFHVVPIFPEEQQTDPNKPIGATQHGNDLLSRLDYSWLWLAIAGGLVALFINCKVAISLSSLYSSVPVQNKPLDAPNRHLLYSDMQLSWS